MNAATPFWSISISTLFPLSFPSQPNPIYIYILHAILYPSTLPFLCTHYFSLPLHSFWHHTIPFCAISPLQFNMTRPHIHSLYSLWPSPFPCSPAPVTPLSLLLVHWWGLCSSPAAIRLTALLPSGEEEESARH